MWLWNFGYQFNLQSIVSSLSEKLGTEVILPTIKSINIIVELPYLYLTDKTMTNKLKYISNDYAQINPTVKYI